MTPAFLGLLVSLLVSSTLALWIVVLGVACTPGGLRQLRQLLTQLLSLPVLPIPEDDRQLCHLHAAP